MSDKPTMDLSASGPLPGHRVVTIEGAGALKFAQAQFMGDVDLLADGRWQWNGWLTPKGRVLALFALLRLDAARVWLLLPDADAEAIAAGLRQLLFRSKARVEVGVGLRVAGMMAAGARARGADIATGADGTLELDMSGDGGVRSLRIRVQTEVDADPDASAGTGDIPGFAESWFAADLEHGLPRLAPAQVGQWTPQQLSLDRLRAYSVRKGCYPGQEIVARTHFLGQAKRGLVNVLAGGPLDVGAELVHDGQVVGTVVASGGNPARALAVVQLDRVESPLRVGGVPASVHVPTGGLAR